MVAKNRYGTRAVRQVVREDLGTKKHPLVVYRGSGLEAENWFATFGGLPGYMGVKFSAEGAIADLWDSIKDRTVYDISGSHNIEPTPANIRALLNRRVRALKAATAASRSAAGQGLIKAASIDNEAKRESIARHDVQAALERVSAWNTIGDVAAFIDRLGPGYLKTAKEITRDGLVSLQRTLEACPERARYLLAHDKLPK